MLNKKYVCVGMYSQNIFLGIEYLEDFHVLWSTISYFYGSITVFLKAYYISKVLIPKTSLTSVEFCLKITIFRMFDYPTVKGEDSTIGFDQSK